MPSPHAQMSDEEAKKEHDDIQNEIAKSKGIKVDEPTVDDPKPDAELAPKEGEDKEPVADEDKDKPEDPDKPEYSKEGDEDDPEDPPKRSSRHIPLAKYQELKRDLKEQTSAKDREIEQLKKDLETAKSSKEVGQVVKEFAEKHNVTEEFAKDMLDMAKSAQPKPDPARDSVLSRAEVFIKKEEAKENFEKEFADLTKDVPDAANLKDKIRTEAYKDGNLDKSLFEIFHRYVKPSESEVVPKKKTAEVTRGPSSARNGPPTFDPKTVADSIKNNTPNALKGLSDEQVDKVFAYMEKNGSVYS